MIRCVTKAIFYVPFTSALVLIVASVLKAHALLTIEQPGRIVWYSRSFLSGLAALELLLGLSTLLRFYPCIAINASRVIFFVFFHVALYLALVGEKVCPCLGILALPPWFMAGFDGIMLAALIACDDSAIHPRTFRTHPRTFAFSCMLFLMTTVPTLLAVNCHNPEEIKNYARKDKRLCANLGLAFNKVDQQAVLDRISSETGIKLKVDSSVVQQQQSFSNLNFKSVPAWVLMEYVARSHGSMRWEKVANEYHLVRQPLWQRLNPWRVAFGILSLEIPCGVILFYWFRKKSLEVA